MNLKNLFLVCILFIFSQNYGQQASYSASIPIVSTSGYYKIKLRPEFIAVSKIGLGNIRILDDRNQTKPYFIDYTKPSIRTGLLKRSFKELRRTIVPNKYSEIIFLDPSGEPVENIILTITNSNVVKSYKILGSQDQKQWFAILDHGILSELYDNTTTTIHKPISLPKTKYTYYKIVINDSTSDPIVIKEIYSDRQFQSLRSSKIKLTEPKTSISNNQNNQIIEFHSQYRYPVDEIQLEFDEKSLFKRPFSILVEEEYKKKKKDVIIHTGFFSKNIDSFKVQLNHTNFKLEIHNNDNPPLKIKNISFYQYPVYLIAYLDSARQYLLETGDPNLNAPDYDIESFRADIPENISILESLGPKPIGSIATQNKSFYQKGWFMWICLLSGILVIFYIAIQMIKNMDAK